MIEFHSMTALGQGVYPVLGYIDPGIISMALQAFFVFMFGAAAAYLTAPWRWFSSLFRRQRDGSAESAGESPVVQDPVSSDQQNSS